MPNANPYNVLYMPFNNIERAKHSFPPIKEAKPQNLFVYSDGPRENTDDWPKILEVRNYIEQNIDWDCNLHKLYREKNGGPWIANYFGMKEAFKTVDKLIVLEDDAVASNSFFEFCEVLLEKYEEDNRIFMICGNNTEGVYKEDAADYFFTESGSIHGFALWKRVFEEWDENYSWLDNSDQLEKLRPHFQNRKSFENFIRLAKERRKTGIPYYETIGGASQYLHNQLNIVSSKNLVSNIGAVDGAHSGRPGKRMIKSKRDLFNSQVYELNFPLKHPRAIANDTDFAKLVYKHLHVGFFENVWNHIINSLFN